VHGVEAGEIAEPLLVVGNDGAEPGRIRGQAREVIEARGRVNGNTRLPIAQIRATGLVEVCDEMRS
jgi:hypothetical protein